MVRDWRVMQQKANSMDLFPKAALLQMKKFATRLTGLLITVLKNLSVDSQVHTFTEKLKMTLRFKLTTAECTFISRVKAFKRFLNLRSSGGEEKCRTIEGKAHHN